MKFRRIRIQPTCLAIIILSVTAAELPASTTNSWISSASGSWTNGANWSSNLPPSIDWSHIQIANTNTKAIMIDAATPAANLTVNNLMLLAPNGFTNTLQLLNVTTNQPLEILNALSIDRGGALNITNSAVLVDGANGGNFNILAGSVMLDSGLIDGSALRFTRVGRNTNGEPGYLTIHGGMMHTTTLYVGELTNAMGVLTVNGGTLNVDSMSPSVTSLSLGETIGSTGIAEITGGKLTVTNGETKIGNLGTGRLTVNGGTVNFFSEVRIADNLVATGVVSVIGGQLTATNAITSIGKYGVGEMTISNATVLLTNVSVGRHDGAVGTLTLQNDGLLKLVDDLSIGRFTNAMGTVLLTGGQLLIANDTIWVGREGIGDMTISNGTAQAKSLLVAVSTVVTNEMDGTVVTNMPVGTFTMTGGSLQITSNLFVGSALISTGQVMMTGGNATITNNSGSAALNVSSGTFTLNGGTLTADNLRLTNSTGQFVFNGGTLQTKATIVADSPPFVVGDGTNAATLRLLGGTHSFANGLIISSNATLTGCGTVIGTVVNHGTISTNCSTPLMLTSITKTGTTASVSFTTLNGLNHTLEYKDALSATSWTAIPPAVLGTGGVTNRMDTNATASTRFYRVRAQ